MRSKKHNMLDRWRLIIPGRPEFYTDPSYGHNGLFSIPLKGVDGKVQLILRVMASTGDDTMPWEHVSVSCPGLERCPTWGEMCYIKDIFWDEEECVIQYHPAKSNYISQHPYCLHMWKPIGVELPKPPAIAVGVAQTNSGSRFSDDQAADIIDRMVGGR